MNCDSCGRDLTNKTVRILPNFYDGRNCYVCDRECEESLIDDKEHRELVFKEVNRQLYDKFIGKQYRFSCIIDTDVLDPFSDSIQLYAKVDDNDNCVVTDDGYTSYNFMCYGQKLETDSDGDIVVKGKWSDLDQLVRKEINLIMQAYSKLKPVGEIND